MSIKNSLLAFAIAFSHVVYGQMKATTVVTEPIFAIDGKYRGGNMPSYNLRNCHGIVPIFDDPKSTSQVLIDSFEVKMQIGNEQRNFLCIGPLFSDEVHKNMDKLTAHDWIQIGEIYYRINDKIASCYPNSMTFFLHFYYAGFSGVYLNILSGFKYERVKGYINFDSLYEVFNIPAMEANKAWKVNNDRDYGVYRETNCSSRSDSCFVRYYSTTDSNKKELLSYSVSSDSITHHISYLSGKPIIDYYWDRRTKIMTGQFILYYPNGHKRLEGSVTACADTDQSNNGGPSYIDPITLQEAVSYNFYSPFVSCPDGEWRYYDESGSLKITKLYDRGTLTSR